ncbi:MULTISPECIES: sigma factor-like helix-turn-helix DNA-binding protein [Clostridiaceae]|uniref:Sigma-70 family RNA polymerase sigma factor n=1 Tax=Clostridium facile TaxID=2763035 RepID=A0ABR7IPN2_9CLOT|nr:MULTISPECIES: sigma factor-like helix-turn-helix DNA-binding protein [Clostridiaceae]MBC5787078.1 sigma-70 family RNA polymerase sigma factor [Clostridium facile]
MNNYRKSDYAVNKFSEGIVYRFNSETIEVTLEDYLKENPGKTEQDFQKLKAISDQIYYEQSKTDHRVTKKNVSIHRLEETNLCSKDTLEDTYIEQLEKELAFQSASELLKDSSLTDIQKRRFLLHIIYGLSTRQIAKQEGVHQNAVWKSIYTATKKLKKIFFDGWSPRG